MANLKEVKSRISSVTSTQQITKAMKMVAAAKLRRAQDAITRMRPYAQKLSEILQNVSAASAEDAGNIYGEQREVVSRVLIIAVTSDKGLAGAFNANIMRRIKIMLEGEYRTQAEAGNVEILPIGKKAADFYRRREIPLQTQFSGLFGNLKFDEAKKVAEFAMDGFVNKTYDKVVVVYNEFKNVATQIVQAEQLLPLERAEKTDEPSAKSANVDYIYEPSKEEIVQELIPKSIKIQLYKALLDSAASEHGARMTAMDKATENAGDLLKELKLMYNRTRQAAITTEILEIVAGAEALSSSR